MLLTCLRGCHCILVDVKGDLISERFSRWLKSPKNMPNQNYELYPPIKEDAQDSAWHIFGEIGGNLKIFLRLSHL